MECNEIALKDWVQNTFLSFLISKQKICFAKRWALTVVTDLDILLQEQSSSTSSSDWPSSNVCGLTRRKNIVEVWMYIWRTWVRIFLQIPFGNVSMLCASIDLYQSEPSRNLKVWSAESARMGCRMIWIPLVCVLSVKTVCVFPKCVMDAQ